jgi:uncharacterized protein (DUF2147 family)
MIRLPIFAALAFFVLAFRPAIGFAAGAGPVGEWKVEDGSATVAIKKCGAAFCGFVASTVGPADKDYRNPDPSLRNRSTLGIQILFNLKPAAPNAWSGLTYNAQDGQIYSAKISLISPTSLQIEGCVPNGGLCGSETWSRVQ